MYKEKLLRIPWIQTETNLLTQHADAGRKRILQTHSVRVHAKKKKLDVKRDY